MRRLSVLLCGILVAGALAITASIDLPKVSAQSGVTVQTRSPMNLRIGPGTRYAVIATVPGGLTLPADARSAASDWVRVLYNSRFGWLAAGYLQVSGNLAWLPVASASSTPGPPPPATPGPPPNGSIESLTLHVKSIHVNYYRLVYWSDGLRIAGFYAEPNDGLQHPAVIYLRGGNRDVGALTGVELAPLAECGFVVVAPQLRGGPGSEGRDEFGGADVHDVTNLIALLKSRPAVDPSRIAMLGGSRGGMMTYLALKKQTQARTKDIKVAATVSGLADLFMWGAERPDLITGFYPEIIGVSPAQNRAPFVERSATYWPWLLTRVPLLLQHGEADTGVSVNQSRKLYRQIRAYGGVAKLITYPDGDHGLSNHQGGYPEALSWFQKYIGRPGDDFSFAAHGDDISYAQSLLVRAAQ